MIAYYFLKGIRQPRLDHIFWLIEHHPEAEVTGLYSMAISPRKTPLNDELTFNARKRSGASRHAAMMTIHKC